MRPPIVEHAIAAGLITEADIKLVSIDGRDYYRATIYTSNKPPRPFTWSAGPQLGNTINLRSTEE